MDIDIQLLELSLTDRNLNGSCGMEKSPIKPFVGLAPSTPAMDKAAQDFQHTSEYKEAPEMEYNVPVEVSSCLRHAESRSFCLKTLSPSPKDVPAALQ